MMAAGPPPKPLEVFAVDVDPELPAYRSFFTSAVVIPPFGFVSLTVEFRPMGAGEYPADLAISSDDPTQPEIRVPLRGISKSVVTQAD